MCLAEFSLSAQPVTKAGNGRGKLVFLHSIMYIQLHIHSALSLGQWPILLPISQRVLDLSHFWVGPDNEDTIQGVMS